MNSIHITQTPLRMSGVPCFAGSRVPLKTLFDYLEAGDSLESFLEQFPSVSRNTAVAALEESRRAAGGLSVQLR